MHTCEVESHLVKCSFHLAYWDCAIFFMLTHSCFYLIKLLATQFYLANRVLCWKLVLLNDVINVFAAASKRRRKRLIAFKISHNFNHTAHMTIAKANALFTHEEHNNKKELIATKRSFCVNQRYWLLHLQHLVWSESERENAKTKNLKRNRNISNGTNLKLNRGKYRKARTYRTERVFKDGILLHW